MTDDMTIDVNADIRKRKRGEGLVASNLFRVRRRDSFGEFTETLEIGTHEEVASVPYFSIEQLDTTVWLHTDHGVFNLHEVTPSSDVPGFIEACCQIDPAYEAKVSDLYEEYRSFGGVGTTRMFCRQMQRHFRPECRNGIRFFAGVKLRTPVEPTALKMSAD